MDFKHFKKVGLSKSGKTTVFKHKDGHFLHIAHGGLLPEHRKAIEDLPCAEGGEIEDDLGVPETQPTPIHGGAMKLAEGTPDGALPDPSEAMQNPEVTGAQQGMDLGTASYNPPQSADTATPAPQEDTSVPAPGLPQNPSNTNLPIQQFMGKELADREQELASGQIRPETYQSLFGKKDTTGKIGTLFGLLVGGAGAGLTHQPNAVLEMMHQTIQNDLDAQQKSASNAQNFLKIAQENPLIQAQAKQTNANAAQVAQTVAFGWTAQHSFDTLAKKVQAMPTATPQQQAAKQAAMQGLQAVYGFMGDKIVNAITAASAITPQPEETQPQEQPKADSLQGVKTILKPGASLQGTQYLPQNKATLPQIQEQFKQAQVADKFLTALPGIFKEAKESITGLGSTASQMEKGMRSFGVPGSVASGITGMASDWEARTRRVGQLKDNLKTELGNLLAHTNIHGDEIDNIVERNFPDGRDSDQDVDKKVANVAAMIKRLIPQSALGPAGLLNK